MIDKAIEELFEANISGKITDERFVKLQHGDLLLQGPVSVKIGSVNNLADLL